MARANVDDARRALLTNILETYLPLKAEQQEELRQMIAAPEAREIQAMISVYETRGIAMGKRESLLRQMRRKFGDLPDEVIRRIEAIKDSEELDRLSDRIFDGATLEELHLPEA